ncbi:MAG TPA: hypothetical protein VJO13_19890 [Ktedonobacterales bacterium]|nr:hypothetical protein [Ktedonobacterales bacterium]
MNMEERFANYVIYVNAARLHVCPEWLGEITCFCVAAASVHELTAPLALVERAVGPLISDHNY